MEKFLKNRIVAVRPITGGLAPDVRSNLILELDKAGIPYLHVGAGAEAAYAILPDGLDPAALEAIAVSCNALVSESGYLTPENFESAEVESDWVERALANHPIDYDIPIGPNYNQALGLCGLCGGIGGHIGPPCKS